MRKKYLLEIHRKLCKLLRKIENQNPDTTIIAHFSKVNLADISLILVDRRTYHFRDERRLLGH